MRLKRRPHPRRNRRALRRIHGVHDLFRRTHTASGKLGAAHAVEFENAGTSIPSGCGGADEGGGLIAGGRGVDDVDGDRSGGVVGYRDGHRTTGALGEGRIRPQRGEEGDAREQ